MKPLRFAFLLLVASWGAMSAFDRGPLAVRSALLVGAGVVLAALLAMRYAIAAKMAREQREAPPAVG